MKRNANEKALVFSKGGIEKDIPVNRNGNFPPNMLIIILDAGATEGRKAVTSEQDMAKLRLT